ncbi:MAG: hypothetical protein HRU76_07045 [Phycisphaeraceae bacterium]|nr:MAG: hypothetical protein HRU76_07045 [Phycisphaeraceae bacterium]
MRPPTTPHPSTEVRPVQRRRSCDIPAIAFGTVVIMWAAGYLCRMSPALVPAWAVLALLVVIQTTGGWVVGRWTARGMAGAAMTGMLTGAINLLVLGAILAEGHSRTEQLIGVVGFLGVTVALTLAGWVLGGRGARGGPHEMINWLGWFAKIAVLATGVLIIAGGLVTGHEAGLAVVDWPNTEGQLMFLYPLSKMTGGVYYEHAHRLYGALVGLTTLALLIAIWRCDGAGGEPSAVRRQPSGGEEQESRRTGEQEGLRREAGDRGAEIRDRGVEATEHQDAKPSEPGTRNPELGTPPTTRPTTTPPLASSLHFARPRPWLRAFAVAAFILVCIQGVLGGLRVTGKVTLSTDPAETQPQVILAIVHGVTAQVFLAMMVSIAAFTSRAWRERSPLLTHPGASTDRTVSAVLVGTLLAQTLLGATFRHLHNHPDYPQGAVTGVLHLHIVVAVVALTLILFLGVRAWGMYRHQPRVHKNGQGLMHAVGMQILLGIVAMVAVLSRGADEPIPWWEVLITTMHQALGAAMLALATLHAIWTRRLLA